jgi:hypothetical protein
MMLLVKHQELHRKEMKSVVVGNLHVHLETKAASASLVRMPVLGMIAVVFSIDWFVIVVPMHMSVLVVVVIM